MIYISYTKKGAYPIFLGKEVKFQNFKKKKCSENALISVKIRKKDY